MNTDIQKYRVWNEYTSRYDSSFIVDQDGEVYRMVDCCENGYDIVHYSENVVVEQCTGLEDRNGKLIYKGDVVRLLPHQLICKVVYQDGCFWLDYEVALYEVFHKIEIIGNIHEMEVTK